MVCPRAELPDAPVRPLAPYLADPTRSNPNAVKRGTPDKIVKLVEVYPNYQLEPAEHHYILHNICCVRKLK